MKITFDKNWNTSTIRSIVKNNSYLEFGYHEDLKALCISPYADDETCYDSDYEELTYVVPKKWLEKVAKEEFEVEVLDMWLQEEYTSDESEVIFSRALSERQVVMVDFM